MSADTNTKYKPQLPYPEGYCTDCKEHIKENDLFGFILGKLFCTHCYKYFKGITKQSFNKRYPLK